LSEKKYKKFINLLNEQKIPTFSMLGYIDVEKGVLSGLTPKFFVRFARRISINIDRILQGEKINKVSTFFDKQNRLILNAKTAKKINFPLSFDMLLDAQILYKEYNSSDLLTIYQAKEKALNNNLLFKIKEEQIKQSRKNHLITWSKYLPLIQYSLNYNIYDAETAKKSFGNVPKWETYNELSFNQLIFSDPVITDIINSKKGIKIRQLEREVQNLDIIYEVSNCYLNYLIAKAINDLEKRNIEIIRHHKNLAIKSEILPLSRPFLLSFKM